MSILVSFTALQAFKNSFSPSDNAVLLLLPKGALLFGVATSGVAVVSICSDGGGGGDGEFAREDLYRQILGISLSNSYLHPRCLLLRLRVMFPEKFLPYRCLRRFFGI